MHKQYMFVLYLESSELLLFIGNFFGIFIAPKFSTKTWIFQYFAFFSKRKDPNNIFLIQAYFLQPGLQLPFLDHFPTLHRWQYIPSLQATAGLVTPIVPKRANVNYWGWMCHI